MAKKSNKANKQRARAANTQWLAENLDRTTLDLDALSSMKIDDVCDELEELNTTSHAAFINALNEKLPQELSIKHAKPSTSRKRRKRASNPKPATDRPAVHSPSPSWLKTFNLRNALILSTLIIILAILIPAMIQGFQSADPQQAADPAIPDSVESSSQEPTRIEGSFKDLRLRGVRYSAENFNPLVPERAPLPPNPDSIEATLKFQVTVDASGAIQSLVSLDVTPHPLEEAVIDSVLLWKFEPVRQAISSDSTTGILTITYFKE